MKTIYFTLFAFLLVTFSQQSMAACKIKGRISAMGLYPTGLNTDSSDSMTFWAQVNNKQFLVGNRKEVRQLLNNAFVANAKVCVKTASTKTIRIHTGSINFTQTKVWIPKVLEISR